MLPAMLHCDKKGRSRPPKAAAGARFPQQPVGHYAPLGGCRLCFSLCIRFNLNNLCYLFVAAFKTIRRPLPV
jgi:hypothetical protein